MRKRIIFIFVAALLFFSFGVRVFAAGIKISAPPDEAVVHPGETIDITIEAVDGFVLNKGILLVSDFFWNNLEALPANFSVAIPNQVTGALPVEVFSADTAGNFYSDKVTLDIQQTSQLNLLDVKPKEMEFTTDWNGNILNGDNAYINVIGSYSDGFDRNIGRDAATQYVSDNPLAAVVNDQGRVEPVGLGEAVITVSNSGKTALVKAAVVKPLGIPPSETISPVTSVDIQPPANPSGWNNSDVSVTLTANDNTGGSGVKELSYRLSGATWEENTVGGDYLKTSISNEGITDLAYYSLDNEGNYEDQQVKTVNLDKTKPVITITSPQADNQYFAGQDIPLTYTAQDALSGIDTTTVTLDGTDVTLQAGIKALVGNHILTITANDKAGNSTVNQTVFTVADNKIRAEVTIKPEVFLRNRGVFIAIVRLPKPHEKGRITQVFCDGAPAKKIIQLKKASLLIFRRQDVTQLPLDTTFIVTGKLANGMAFEGADTIRKIIGGAKTGAKDKKGEQGEISQCCRDNGIDCARDIEDND